MKGLSDHGRQRCRRGARVFGPPDPIFVLYGKGWANEQDIEVLADPLATGQALHSRTVKAAGRAQVEIFHGGALAHVRSPKAVFQGRSLRV